MAALFGFGRPAGKDPSHRPGAGVLDQVYLSRKLIPIQLRARYIVLNAVNEPHLVTNSAVPVEPKFG